jgi:hypothetical protein
LDLGSQSLFFFFKLYMRTYLLFLEPLTSLFQIGYGILLLHIGLLHFIVVMRHLFKVNLETLQIVVSFPIELIELDIFLL